MIQNLLGPLSGAESIAWVQQLFGVHPLPFRLLSLPGDLWGILLAIAIARWYFGPRPAAAMAVATALAAPVRLGLAALFAVPRPAGPGITVFEHPEIAAFPSGHTLHAVVAWGVLAATTRVPYAVAALAAVATGLGRVYLGVHYPADVLASLLLGPLFVGAFLPAWRRLWPRLAQLPARARAGVAALAALAVVALAVGPLVPGRLQHWEILGAVAGTLVVLAAPATPDAPIPGGARRAGFAALIGLAAFARLAVAPGSGWAAAGAACAAVLVVFRLVPSATPRPPVRSPPG